MPSKNNLSIQHPLLINYFLFLADKNSKIANNKRESGFSLLEMVVVLAIIGILITIQLPNILGNTEKARFIAAISTVTNAITECVTARNSGVSSSELSFKSTKILNHVPSLGADPESYRFQRGVDNGCDAIVLVPINSEGKDDFESGFPILAARTISGGRIVKAVFACKPAGSVDFTDECKRWDFTMDPKTGETGRDMDDPEWRIKEDNT